MNIHSIKVIFPTEELQPTYPTKTYLVLAKSRLKAERALLRQSSIPDHARVSYQGTHGVDEVIEAGTGEQIVKNLRGSLPTAGQMRAAA